MVCRHGAVLLGDVLVNAAIFVPFYFVVEVTDLLARLSATRPHGSLAHWLDPGALIKGTLSRPSFWLCAGRPSRSRAGTSSGRRHPRLRQSTFPRDLVAAEVRDRLDHLTASDGDLADLARRYDAVLDQIEQGTRDGRWTMDPADEAQMRLERAYAERRADDIEASATISNGWRKRSCRRKKSMPSSSIARRS